MPAKRSAALAVVLTKAKTILGSAYASDAFLEVVGTKKEPWYRILTRSGFCNQVQAQGESWEAALADLERRKILKYSTTSLARSSKALDTRKSKLDT